MTSEDKKRWALDGVGHHFHYDRREGKILTQYLLLANNKEHHTYPQEVIVWLEWQDVTIKRILIQSVRTLQAMSAVVFQRRRRLTPDSVIKEVFCGSGI